VANAPAIFGLESPIRNRKARSGRSCEVKSSCAIHGNRGCTTAAPETVSQVTGVFHDRPARVESGKECRWITSAATLNRFQRLYARMLIPLPLQSSGEV